MRFVPSMILALVIASSASAETITVGAAVSLREALAEIAAKYKADGAGEVRLVFGSSGQLMGQIRNGAPIDVFISAADRQVDELLKGEHVVERSRRVVAGNTLALIVPAQAKSPPVRLRDLADARYRRIAIGAPKTVPAGEYAMQALRSLGIADAVAGRMIEGTNVRQVLGYVERGEVSAGIVYFTDALLSGEKVHLVERADEKLHEPINYTAVIVRASRRPGDAQRFIDYLGTAQSRKSLQDRGFEVPRLKTSRVREP